MHVLEIWSTCDKNYSSLSCMKPRFLTFEGTITEFLKETVRSWLGDGLFDEKKLSLAEIQFEVVGCHPVGDVSQAV